MLKCPHCNKDVIRFKDYYLMRSRDIEFCPNCDKMYKITPGSSLIGIMSGPLMVMILTLLAFTILGREVFLKTGLILLFFGFGMIGTPYYLYYKKLVTLRKYEGDNTDLKLSEIDNEKLESILKSLYEGNIPDWVVSIHNENQPSSYFDLGINGQQFSISLSLTTKQSRDLEQGFLKHAGIFSNNLSKQKKNEIEFYEIQIGDSAKRAVDAISQFSRLLFGLKNDNCHFVSMPDCELQKKYLTTASS